MSNEVVTKSPRLSQYLAMPKIEHMINSTLGSENRQRFITSLISSVSTNPALAECTHESLVSSALVGESLQLSTSPHLGQFFIMPFKNTRQNNVVATPVIGYKGYWQLALRSNQYERLIVVSIKKGELKRYNILTEEIELDIIDDDLVRENAETTGYYAMFKLLNGFTKTMYFSRAKMEAHALRYSKAYAADKKYKTQKSFWTTDFDAQGLKTMIRQIISKWGVMSIEMQMAFENDNFDNENLLFDENYVESIPLEKIDAALDSQIQSKTEIPIEEELDDWSDCK